MLSANASSESILRLNYAQVLAEACPQDLFTEIALTGSSARGIATPDSDIEINFWVVSLPELRHRLHWMRSEGIQQIIAHTEPRPDNSYWLNGIIHNIEIEAGWQTFADLDSALTQLINAQTTDHKALRLAELVLSAKSLRGDGALSKWQPILKNYPSELTPKLIETALSDWLNTQWHIHHTGENPYKDDIYRIWRVLFALNHQWEINWKYAHHSLSSLQIYPNNIVQRIWGIQQADTQSALQPMLTLIQEILELIKHNIGNCKGLSENLKLSQQLLDDIL